MGWTSMLSGFMGGGGGGMMGGGKKKGSETPGRRQIKTTPFAKYSANQATRRKRRKKGIYSGRGKLKNGGFMAGLMAKYGSGRGQQQGAQGPVKRSTTSVNPMAGKPRRPERESPGMTGYSRYLKPGGRGGRT